MATAGELSVDPRLDRYEAKLLESGDLALRKALVGEIHERRPAPQPERLVELVELAGLHRLLQALAVELALLYGQQVPGRPRDEPLAELLAEQRHVVAHDLGGGGGGDPSQSSSTRRSTETTSFRWSRSAATRASWRPLPSGTIRPSRTTSSCPRMRNSIPAHDRSVYGVSAGPSRVDGRRRLTVGPWSGIA